MGLDAWMGAYLIDFEVIVDTAIVRITDEGSVRIGDDGETRVLGTA